MNFLVFLSNCILSWLGFRQYKPIIKEHQRLREAIFQLQNELRQ